MLLLLLLLSEVEGDSGRPGWRVPRPAAAAAAAAAVVCCPPGLPRPCLAAEIFEASVAVSFKTEMAPESAAVAARLAHDTHEHPMCIGGASSETTRFKLKALLSFFNNQGFSN